MNVHLKERIRIILLKLFLKREGLSGLRYLNRKQLMASIPASAKVLEIDPFFCPLMTGKNVSYFDVLNPDGLKKRADMLGFEKDDIPTKIHYHSPKGDLSIVDKKFDYVVSSHNIEHHPDLISHLQHLERILKPNGKFIAIMPDTRLYYDHFVPRSTIADILDAYINKAKKHSLRNIINQKALRSETLPLKHLFGIHGESEYKKNINLISESIEDYNKAKSVYLDSHAWYFTPRSFKENIKLLNELGFTKFKLNEIIRSSSYAWEFAVILEKGKK